MEPKARRSVLPAVYGLKDDSPLLPWSHVSSRMESAKHYWLSTVGPAGLPHTRPIDGMWLDGELWFGGSEESRWRRNLAHNPSVCVNLEDAEEAVMLHGRVRQVKADTALATRLAAASNEKYGYGQTAEMYQREAVLVFRPEYGLAWKLLYEDATRWDLR